MLRPGQTAEDRFSPDPVPAAASRRTSSSRRTQPQTPPLRPHRQPDARVHATHAFKGLEPGNYCDPSGHSGLRADPVSGNGSEATSAGFPSLYGAGFPIASESREPFASGDRARHHDGTQEFLPEHTPLANDVAPTRSEAWCDQLPPRRRECLRLNPDSWSDTMPDPSGPARGRCFRSNRLPDSLGQVILRRRDQLGADRSFLNPLMGRGAVRTEFAATETDGSSATDLESPSSWRTSLVYPICRVADRPRCSTVLPVARPYPVESLRNGFHEV